MSEGKDKLKIGLYWAASCGGCEIAVLDIDEAILDVVAKADIVFWPVAMDVKYKDVENMEDGYMDICFFNGGIRTEENEALAKLLRRKSKILVAFGACACHGGDIGLANLSTREELLKTAYINTPSTDNKENIMPVKETEVKEGKLELPLLVPKLKTLDMVVDVDYYIPGCPPSPNIILDALKAVFEGKLPPRGSVLAPPHNLCKDCPRNTNKGEETPPAKSMPDIKRIYEVDEIDEDKCFLEQGLICMGPVTRAGCNHRCIKGNHPCTGCFGPAEGVLDPGAKMISVIGSLLEVEDEKEAEALAEKIKDYIGTFYMYDYPKSMLGGWRK